MPVDEWGLGGAHMRLVRRFPGRCVCRPASLVPISSLADGVLAPDNNAEARMMRSGCETSSPLLLSRSTYFFGLTLWMAYMPSGARPKVKVT